MFHYLNILLYLLFTMSKDMDRIRECVFKIKLGLAPNKKKLYKYWALIQPFVLTICRISDEINHSITHVRIFAMQKGTRKSLFKYCKWQLIFLVSFQRPSACEE